MGLCALRSVARFVSQRVPSGDLNNHHVKGREFQTWDRWSQCFWEGLARSIRRIVSEIILLFSDVGMSRLIEFRLISVPIHAKKEHAA